MPDTQFYARYGTEEAGDIFGTRYGSNPFDVQTQFFADNHKALNMPFVTHLGDVVDEADVDASWDIASRAMKRLEDANVDYSILPGNHDLHMRGEKSAFETYFPISRVDDNSTFGGRFTSPNDLSGQKVESEYHVFEAEGQEYVVLALGYRADDATLEWAQRVIDANPTRPVILTAHEISDIDGEGKTFYSADYGEHLWDKLIRKNDQIFLTIAGHHHGAGHHLSTNDAGHQVINILQDYQMAYLGGNGLGGLLQFDLTGNKLDMRAFSPWVQGKDYAKLTQFDELMPAGPGDSYSVDINFAERFAGFNEQWTPGEADDPDYTKVLAETVTAGYVPYEVPKNQLPHGPQDYAHVEGTAVHWRPGMANVDGKGFSEGQVVPVGAVIPDVEKQQDMKRAPLAAGASEAMVTFSEDTHPLSSDVGSLRWDEPTAKAAVSYFETAADAAINSENFENGYTLEAFLKLDEDFNGDENGWSNALIRNASGTDIEPSLNDGDPAQMLGVSNLRELRWYALGENKEGFSNWSHEVPKGRWMHVAVVNDPADKSVTMYIDGAPILRDGYGPVGMAGENFTWLLGTSAWEGTKEDGWFGSIGEIRMVDHPIGPDQWLTARVSTDGGSSHSSAGMIGVWVAVLAVIAAIAVGLSGVFTPLVGKLRELLNL